MDRNNNPQKPNDPQKPQEKKPRGSIFLALLIAISLVLVG